MNLANTLIRTAQQRPDAVAICAGATSTTYDELNRLAGTLASFMTAKGVLKQDRVALCLDKGPKAIAVMQGALRIGAAYVPLDPLAPTTRMRQILKDCGVRLVVATAACIESLLASETQELDTVEFLVADQDAGPVCERKSSWGELSAHAQCQASALECEDDDLAYILYTSGSTGTPKGVCLSHKNALAFVDWAYEMSKPTSADRFSSHAPFHFDLSVLDLYVAFKAGACVVVIADADAYLPDRLVRILLDERITVWYSVPSVWVLMMQHGQLLSARAPSLRLILFAGEPFPVPHLCRLMEHFPQAAYWNLFGPTETNVCTAYQVASIPRDVRSIPIGKAVCGNRAWVQTEDQRCGSVGDSGELYIDGPTVMLGYWGAERVSGKPYATGDMVRIGQDGNYLYMGRRDSMLKVRGHRIEPQEVESVLETHPAVQRAAVVKDGEGTNARLVAVLQIRAKARAPTLLELKRLCAENLPRSMIIDSVRVIEEMPLNRNGKLDRKALNILDIDLLNSSSNPR